MLESFEDKHVSGQTSSGVHFLEGFCGQPQSVKNEDKLA